METKVHGGLPEGTHDPHGVLAEKHGPTATERFAAARAKVAELTRSHAEAQNKWQSAVADNEETHYDFQTLKANVARLARDLEEAGEQADNWANVCVKLEKTNRQQRFDAALKEARAARAEFQEHFKAGCLALGRWYQLAGEVCELANQLATRLPTGHIYHDPELKEAGAEMAKDPNPLTEILDSGFVELQTHQSWRRHVAVVPLVKKENR